MKEKREKREERRDKREERREKREEYPSLSNTEMSTLHDQMNALTAPPYNTGYMN